MKLFNVLTKKVITKEGQPLTLWHRVGLIKATQGGNWYLQLFQQPETDFYVLEHQQGDAEMPTVQVGEEA